MKCLIVFLALTVYVAESIRVDTYANTLLDSTRIIGGDDAREGEFPYQVSIRHRVLTIGSRSHICGGILIQRGWVLTAAHCKQRSGSYEVALGQLKRSDKGKKVQIIPVKAFINHENFPGGVAKYDIALLKLTKQAEITDTVKPINVPSGDVCDVLTSRVLSGWGRTRALIPTFPNRLQRAELPIISEEDCDKGLSSILGNSRPLDETMVCTLYNSNKPKSGCMGDSGGPLADLKNNTIIGIVSWGIVPCGTKGAPTVYTNVCSYSEWIEETIAENS